MGDLQGKMAENYQRHPSFRFDPPPFALDAARAQTFNDSYRRLADQGALMTRPARAAGRRECRAALDAVFDDLAPHATDEHEARFLSELRAQCRRLLDEELDHMCRVPRRIRLDGNAQAIAVDLQRQRFHFAVLPRSAVQEILDLGAADLERFRQRAAKGQVTRDDLSVNTGPAVARICRILNREYGKLGALDAISAYMGRPMTVSGVALELSVPQATWWANHLEGLARPPTTLYAHVDESVVHPKSIVYLTAVDAARGPTSCYPHAFDELGLDPLALLVGRVIGQVGAAADSPLREHYSKPYHQAMSSDAFRRHFMRLPPALRFYSHLGWDVLPDSDLEAALTRRETVMLGPAGTFILFDGGNLLHRGGLMEQGERIALQVIFSDSSPWARVVRRLRRATA